MNSEIEHRNLARVNAKQHAKSNTQNYTSLRVECRRFAPVPRARPGASRARDKFSPVAFDYAYAAIAQIRAFAGVQVMIENIPNEISTLDRIGEFKTVAEVSDI